MKSCRLPERAHSTLSIKRKPRGEQVTTAYFLERSEVDPLTGCWLWRGAMTPNGYGAVNHQGRATRAHRLSYIVATGEAIDRQTDVCHRCDVRNCVNPAHLFAGSRADNMRDCANKGRIRVPLLEGEASPNSKLTADQVRAIRADQRPGREIARAYGVDKGTIAGIRRRDTWRSI